jgi:hypothetical protein
VVSGSAGRRKNRVAGQFAARPIEMLNSPAYRVLSRAAHLVLSRLEVEHANHGGRDNGRLPCTYEHFEEYGLQRRSIPPAIRELAALGLIEVTEKGVAGNSEFRQPSRYRLTYRPAHNAPGDGTHEYRKFTTFPEAEAVAEHARQNANPHAVAAGKKRNPGGSFSTASVAENANETARPPVAINATTVPAA